MKAARAIAHLLATLSCVVVGACSMRPVTPKHALPPPPPPPPFTQRSFPEGLDASYRPKAGTVRLTEGATTATVSYTPGSAIGEAATRVVVTHAASTLFDRIVDINAPRIVALAGTHTTHQPLLILKTYSGGAHCCIGSIIIDAESDTDIHVRQDDWGDGDFEVRPGTRSKDPVLVASQAAMPYAFGSFAGTAFVVKVMRYQHGEIANAARSYPEIVEADARRHLRDYLHEGSGERPIGKSSLIAYMIDMCRIDRCNKGWGKVKDVYGESDREDFFPVVIKALKQYGTAIPTRL